MDSIEIFFYLWFEITYFFQPHSNFVKFATCFPFTLHDSIVVDQQKTWINSWIRSYSPGSSRAVPLGWKRESTKERMLELMVPPLYGADAKGWEMCRWLKKKQVFLLKTWVPFWKHTFTKRLLFNTCWGFTWPWKRQKELCYASMDMIWREPTKKGREFRQRTQQDGLCPACQNSLASKRVRKQKGKMRVC